MEYTIDLMLLVVSVILLLSPNSIHTLESSESEASALRDKRCHSPHELTNDKTSHCLENTKNTNMALVVYDERHSFLGRFYDDKWVYVCKDKLLNVEQKWNDLGVAGVVWDAATILSDYLQQNAVIVKDKRVIEIGAGTGLAGICANILGGNVTITDREMVLDHINNVVNANDLNNSRLKVLELDWTKDYTELGKFDVILGADVIYIESLFDDLLKTLTNLSNRNSAIFLSCKLRYEKDWRFIEKLKSVMHVEEILHNTEKDIRIFKANKKV